MIGIKILRTLNVSKEMRKLHVEEILDIKWTSKSNFSGGVYEYFFQNESYILYFPECIEKNRDYFDTMTEELEDYFDDYELTEEQFKFLKLKLI